LASGYKRVYEHMGSNVMVVFSTVDEMTTSNNPSCLGWELIRISWEGEVLKRCHKASVCEWVRGSIDDAKRKLATGMVPCT
jgi:hypothetical protein